MILNKLHYYELFISTIIHTQQVLVLELIPNTEYRVPSGSQYRAGHNNERSQYRAGHIPNGRTPLEPLN